MNKGAPVSLLSHILSGTGRVHSWSLNDAKRLKRLEFKILQNLRF